MKCCRLHSVLLIWSVLVILGRAQRSPSLSCSLKVTQSTESLQPNPGENVTLLCNATCPGRLSRDQLIWRDPHGNRISSTPGRVFAVNYNQWRFSRLMLLLVDVEDSGTYTCELNYDTIHIQYTSILQIRENFNAHRSNDPGPRRGDIHIEKEVEFDHVRPVREVASRFNMAPIRLNFHPFKKSVHETNMEDRYKAEYRLKRNAVTSDYITENTSSMELSPQKEDSTISTSEETEHTSSFPPPTTSSQETTATKVATKSLATKTPQINQSQTTTPSSTDKADDRFPGHKSSTSGEGNSESDFGRYGVLAFALTLAIAVLLLYALLLVIFVPRCCGRAKRKNITSSEGGCQMEQVQHKKLAPMSSATGLHGEYITAVDLDTEAGNQKPSDKEQKTDDTAAASKTHPQSLVSTFLDDHVNPSKPETHSHEVSGTASSAVVDSTSKADGMLKSSQSGDSGKNLSKQSEPVNDKAVDHEHETAAAITPNVTNNSLDLKQPEEKNSKLSNEAAFAGTGRSETPQVNIQPQAGDEKLSKEAGGLKTNSGDENGLLHELGLELNTSTFQDVLLVTDGL